LGVPELRKDPVTGRWVIIAVERGKRPSDFGRAKDTRRGAPCPFCAGEESKTPPEIFAFRNNGSPANSPDWNLRVVPNKYPALCIEGDLDKKGIGIFDRMNGIGAHEVIVETPDHDKAFADFTDEEAQMVVWAYRERMTDLKNDPRFRYTLIFRNWGEPAGASLEHAHSQLICVPATPKRVMEEIRGAQRHFEFRERCVYCDIIDQELADGERVVCENDAFVCLTPFASVFPFEMWILPKKHHTAFMHIGDEQLRAFARILRNCLKKLTNALDDPPFNYVIHTAPYGQEALEYYHWHLELMPRLIKHAGFEWGTGFYINPTPPETAAQHLREA
jgi:UDPglucose--hexose-1-phosphate uridylyltransferase